MRKTNNHQKQQAKQTTDDIMASRSTGWMYSNGYGQQLPNTFNKLTTFWNGKIGNRDHTANIFYNTSANEPKTHVPFLLMSAFNRIHGENGDMVSVFKNINPSAIKVDNDQESVWIYTMRQSDALPRTTQDMECVFVFVRMFMEKHLDSESNVYLMKHINITVCFFIWFFTTPNFFFNKKVVKQTTRGGIKKVWRSILLGKPPVHIITAVTHHKRGVNHQTNILSNLEKEKETIQQNIVSIIQSVHPDFTIKWDQYDYHTKISETLQYNNANYVSGKKNKKIQKLYRDYQKINEKIKISKKSISSVNNQQQAKLTINIPLNDQIYDWNPIGSPPSPPKLIRQNATTGTQYNTPHVISTDHVNGPYPLDVDDDVPDSWEDL
tara:strand:+ start:1312 stop:2451 length:1140 start_codon:yes stop_codon:yes gene_type:complete